MQKKCIPCEGGLLNLLTEEEIQKNLKQIKDWQVIGKKITKLFTFKDFAEAMAFVKKVADIAETEGHHPDINISYNKVTVEITTHALGGLSLNDFIVADRIDSIF